ncbi:MAG: DUF3667 domain-containing protein [Cyclobacteriaceae bacterium]|nr:DUF3667 domain-containing protein [Cyclobacteriaceae bacterium]
MNNDNNVSFGTLLFDFFSNYFSLDGRFAHSFFPFFIKPGYLTNKFNEGKRMSFANPIRLYLVISLFFFFVFSNVGKKIIATDDSIVSTKQTSKSITTNNDSNAITVKDLKEMKAELSDFAFKMVIKNLPKEEKESLIEKLSYEDAVKYYLIPSGTVFPKERSEKKQGDMSFMGDGKFNWDVYDHKLKENDDLSETQILDSIYLGGASNLELLIVKQKIKVERTETEYFIGFALKNLPFMMFALLPMFALFLKLLYFRRNTLYIKHLIHALHLHSFAYLIYGITLLISFYYIENDSLSSWITILSFLTVSTYAYLSFLKVYKQHWLKTLVKFNIQGLAYSLLLVLFFAFEMAVSFLLF